MCEADVKGAGNRLPRMKSILEWITKPLACDRARVVEIRHEEESGVTPCPIPVAAGG